MNFPVKIIRYLENKPKYFLIGLGLLLVLILGFIDYIIPRDISVSIFYLIPICITTWFAGEKAGIVISIASTIAWFIANKTLEEAPSSSAIHYWNASVRLGFFLTVTYLLSELRSARQKEKTLARTDPTTGVANRQLFSELATLEIKRARRYGHPFTLAYIDVDDFKNINKYGSYQIGDRLLLTLAQTIKKTIRDTDILARIGGDEFALLLPGIGYETAHTVIARVQQQLVDTMDENKWPATFSIGAITFLNPPDSVDEIVEKADYLMYCIKNEGKNRIEHIIEQ
ncbi:GGDEF domain-containing protein [Argonema galeatum]|uniref:GGDEF domain-containing protein n=1 Tax=Argonema galeatum TaxID=2942762 RepID=UPI002012C909|nr:GGDEF domain-containing protein [Argonema galeatum]MCL1466058.1 GGDEF domain-containing protein [Argonema galeatum A003/A1]